MVHPRLSRGRMRHQSNALPHYKGDGRRRPVLFHCVCSLIALIALPDFLC